MPLVMCLVFIGVIIEIIPEWAGTYQAGAGYASTAMKKEVTAEQQLHSDQSFQYVSQSYFTLVTQYDITSSVSRRAAPYDNAVTENFFSILKSDGVSLYKPETIHKAQTLIDGLLFKTMNIFSLI